MTQPTSQHILVAGPTASGKSALALALAARNGGTIVNADSMQVYDTAPILTSRPTADDLSRAPHRLYGFVPPQEAYSVGRWLSDVARLLDEGDTPLIFVGGTGLYFNGLTQGLADTPEIADAFRERWRESGLDAPGLHAELATRDPAMAMRLRPSDTQRIVRALEVIDATGRSLTEWQSLRAEPLVPPEDTIRIVAAPPRDALYAIIDSRFDRMVEEGALDEARAVAALDLDPGLPFSRALGLRPLIAHVRGELSLDDAMIRSRTDCRRYAKRQITWLRKFMADWDWVETSDQGLKAVSRMSDSEIRGIQLKE